MKELKLSQLMDEYVDREFFPEEGSAVNAEAVKARVLARAGVPLKKRQTPPLTRILLAAALAAGCLLSIAAALPIIAYRQLDGSSVLVQTDGEHYLYIGFDESEWEEPVILEDGRLWLVAGGRRIDITGLIDAETPFLAEGADPDSGLKSYLIAGGTRRILDGKSGRSCPWEITTAAGGTATKPMSPLMVWTTYTTTSRKNRGRAHILLQ